MVKFDGQIDTRLCWGDVIERRGDQVVVEHVEGHVEEHHLPLRVQALGVRAGGRNTLHGFRGFHIENGSSQGQNPALTGLCVPRACTPTPGSLPRRQAPPGVWGAGMRDKSVRL